MDFWDLGQWGSTIIIAIALVRTIRRNGKDQKARDTTIAKDTADREAVTQERLRVLAEVIKSPHFGLAALKEDIGHIKTNCADVTSGFTERLKTLEKTEKS